MKNLIEILLTITFSEYCQEIYVCVSDVAGGVMFDD
jgi:hypothetical protein